MNIQSNESFFFLCRCIHQSKASEICPTNSLLMTGITRSSLPEACQCPREQALAPDAARPMYPSGDFSWAPFLTHFSKERVYFPLYAVTPSFDGSPLGPHSADISTGFNSAYKGPMRTYHKLETFN